MRSCRGRRGNWTQVASFVGEFSFARARDTQPLLRWAAALAWQRRWSRIVSTACGHAFAQSLVAPAGEVAAVATDGGAPALSELLSR